MNTRLTILTVNYNTAQFVSVMLYALHRLTVSRYAVLVCDNGSRDADVLRLAAALREHPSSALYLRRQSTAGSVGHGEALDLLASQVRTPYFALLDSDCVPLRQGWDDVLIRRLQDGAGAIGAPPISTQSVKPVDFPSVYFTMYSTEAFRTARASFRPSPTDPRRLDTGYELREAFAGRGLGVELLAAESTRSFRGGPFADVICTECYLDASERLQGRAMAAHFSRGSSGGVAKYRRGAFSVPVLSALLARRRASLEKGRWLGRCRAIVNREALSNVEARGVGG